jgi:hypothetical protein
VNDEASATFGCGARLVVVILAFLGHRRGVVGDRDSG